MADKTDKMAVVRKGKGVKTRRYRDKIIISPEKLSFIQLVAAGHSVFHVAQVLGIAQQTAYDWKDDLREHIEGAQQLSIEAAQDAVKAMVPDALKSFQRMIRSEKAKVSYQPSRDILISQRVIADRKTIEQEDANRSTDSLQSEYRSIVERAQAIADKRSEEAWPVKPDPERS